MTTTLPPVGGGGGGGGGGGVVAGALVWLPDVVTDGVFTGAEFEVVAPGDELPDADGDPLVLGLCVGLDEPVPLAQGVGVGVGLPVGVPEGVVEGVSVGVGVGDPEGDAEPLEPLGLALGDPEVHVGSGVKVEPAAACAGTPSATPIATVPVATAPITTTVERPVCLRLTTMRPPPLPCPAVRGACALTDLRCEERTGPP